MSTTADVDLDRVDLMDEDLYVDGPPHALFALRFHHPSWNSRQV